MPFPVGGPLQPASISNCFRDICIQVYLGHDLDHLGPLGWRDVVGHPDFNSVRNLEPSLQKFGVPKKSKFWQFRELIANISEMQQEIVICQT